MEYSFQLKKGKKNIPVVRFSDSANALAGEFLLAERGILNEITALLQSRTDGRLSGNAFTLHTKGNRVIIVNDITHKTLTVDAYEFRTLAEDYDAEIKRLRKRT